jgi:hypothetical protein
MVKKIIMDMKINGKRTLKSVPREKDVFLPSLSEPKNEEVVAESNLSQERSFAERDSLRRAAVFSSGWHSDTESSLLQEKKSDIPQALSRKMRTTPSLRRKAPPLRKSLRITLLAVFLFACAYFSLYFFEQARITIVTKNQSFTLDHKEFEASKKADAPIDFELMIVPDTRSEEITFIEPKEVSLKAKGEVTLYNEYSTKGEKLTAGTFLADPNGKAYKIDKSITIPGYTLVNKKIIPGQISVPITAFLPGQSYNGDLTDFTITAFKNTAKYKKIYGKSKTPLSGGAEGTAYTLGPEETGRLNAIASSSFKAALLKKAYAEIPKGYILYPNALTFSYHVDTDVLSPTPNAKIPITGTISALLLAEDDLRIALAKNLIPGISSGELNEIEILGLDKLSLDFVETAQVINKDTDKVSFTLTGPLSLLWHPDIDVLKRKILGIQKKDIEAIFKSDPGITSAIVKIFPPWQSHLPEDETKIHLKTQ